MILLPLILVFYSCAAILLLLALTLSTKHAKKSVRRCKSPPGPTRLPFIGNLHELGAPLHRSFSHLADQHGDLMFMKLGSVPAVVISSADLAGEIFKTHDLVFSGRPELYTAKKLSYNCSNISFSPCNENWRMLKKIATMELLSPKRVQSYQAVRDEEGTRMIDSIAQSSGPINLSKLLIGLSNTILCRVAFGRNPDEDGRYGTSRVGDILHEVQDLLAAIGIADFFPWLSWLNKFNGLDSRLDKIFRELDVLYDGIIEEHLNRKGPKLEEEDVVDVLLRVKNDPDQQITLSDDSIKGVLTDIFVAGTDTNATTLIWTMTELIRNPSVMRKAQDEIRKAVQGRNRVEESELSKLTYLKLVVKESLRLHPPAPLLVPRETTEDCVIRGHKIPAKTWVFINASKILMDPQTWKNPEEFKPERFQNSLIDVKGQHFELIPFGVGRRRCPGISFSLPLIEITLANLLNCFDWELPPGVTKEDIDMEESAGITMNKKIPLCLVAKTPAD